ncbi:hypothetical protein [Corynebacterium provencense]|jgi:hypothetical protein|uniref:hypothetical protein n=1 Tax=Corynebacterium provencense TaxID=1737425 RepID=UPI00082DAFC8|nr:hypothetical protein [Corynebacterium provencense]MCI1256931.1 hypothetical protein [Corynebacterium provencense]
MTIRTLPRRAALVSALMVPVTATTLMLTACGGGSSMNQAQACDFLNEFYFDHLDDFESDGETPLSDHLSKDLNNDYKNAVKTLRKSDDENLRGEADKMPATTKDITDDDSNYIIEGTIDACPSLSDPHYGDNNRD